MGGALKTRVEFIVYAVGIVLFGLVYEKFKSLLGGGFWFLVAALAYLLVLRLIGATTRRYFKNRETP